MPNMRVLTPSRKAVKPGDIFVMQLRDDEYIFGRVIRTDAMIDEMQNVILIYVYRAFSFDKTAIPVLNRDQLLIAPDLINRLGWSRGYFEMVAHHPLTPEDVLPVHCFQSYFSGKYFDEYNHQLPEKHEPCGQYGLGNYRVIDDLVSRALDIPLAPD